MPTSKKPAGELLGELRQARVVFHRGRDGDHVVEPVADFHYRAAEHVRVCRERGLLLLRPVTLSKAPIPWNWQAFCSANR
jgi:hypothetical protein